MGASLPFARPIQKLLDKHRLLIGRLFLATLRAVMPKDSHIPLTTLRDVGRMAAWALGNPEKSQGKTYEVIGSNETAETLCAVWTEVRGQTIPRIPGLSLGIRVGHPNVLTLLHWLANRPNTIPNESLDLTTHVEWVSQETNHG